MKRLALLLLIACACSPMVYTHGVPNFVSVGHDVYRGGQPTEAGWEYLHALGFVSVVKLNEEAEGSDATATALGMSVYYATITREQTVVLVSTEQVKEAAGMIATAAQSGPVYVHCEHGEDRTGLVIAAYRVLYEGWTKERAQAEMNAHHFHWELPGLVWAWHDL